MFRGGDGIANGAGATLINNTELVICTLGPIEVPSDTTRVLVYGLCTVTGGTTATSLNTRIRRGSTLADTAVGFQSAALLSAGVLGQASVLVIDVLALAATVTYSMTAQQVGATANAAVASAEMFVLFI